MKGYEGRLGWKGVRCGGNWLRENGYRRCHPPHCNLYHTPVKPRSNLGIAATAFTLHSLAHHCHHAGTTSRLTAGLDLLRCPLPPSSTP